MKQLSEFEYQRMDRLPPSANGRRVGVNFDFYEKDAYTTLLLFPDGQILARTTRVGEHEWLATYSGQFRRFVCRKGAIDWITQIVEAGGI